MCISPDLNPKEHLCDEFGRRLQDCPVQPQNPPQLEGFLNKEWEQIHKNCERHLVRPYFDSVIAAGESSLN